MACTTRAVAELVEGVRRVAVIARVARDGIGQRLACRKGTVRRVATSPTCAGDTPQVQRPVAAWTDRGRATRQRKAGVLGDNADPKWIDAHLKSRHLILADISNVARNTYAHTFLIVRKEGGKYLIFDPWSGRQHLTPEQLSAQVQELRDRRRRMEGDDRTGLLAVSPR
jgi:hypothetical protein